MPVNFISSFLLAAILGVGEEELLEDPRVEPVALDYSVILDTVSTGYTDSTSWFYPSAGIIHSDKPVVVLTMQEWVTGRSDVFNPVMSLHSLDSGKSWTSPADVGGAFAFRKEPGNIEVGVCNFTPKWHNQTKTLLGTGHTVRYRHKELVVGTRSTIWSTYNPKTHQWDKWQSLKMPNDSIYYDAGMCSDQRVDLSNGDVLLPIYYRARGVVPYKTRVIRCTFDGLNLTYQEQGNELSIDVGRGAFEPSLMEFGGTFYMTIRNDENGYWSSSTDGLIFSKPQVWHFDNGDEVGTYNTQQHWIKHADGLFLVYTRKGADNDHVFRHRAPLFIARVDTDKMVLIKDSEKVVVPNRGARLGNFSITNINENETWVTAAELMTGNGEEEHGAEGNVFVARLRWNTPNSAWLD